MLLAFTLFPLLAVVSISLRPGNFATGSLIPSTIGFEHWQLPLGMPVKQPDGTVMQPPFPVLLPVAVALVAIYAIFDGIGQSIP